MSALPLELGQRPSTAYDQWFWEQVARSLIEADDPATGWIRHEVVQEGWRRQRETILARLGRTR